MTSLARLQQTFQQCVLDPGNEHDIGWISVAGRADPASQLSVYSNAYGARLSEVLGEDYPAVQRAIGDQAFEQLAADYIAACPSRFYSLRAFGTRLPDFIAAVAESHVLYEQRHWLAELARFEWTLGEAFDAADTPLFSEQQMAAIPPQHWPELSFSLHPSVQRLDLQWNAVAMWQALAAEPPIAVSAEPDAGGWLIWRQQLVTRFRSLTEDEQQALDCVRAGGCFNDLCEQLALLIDEEQVPMRAATLLKGWIVQGLICGVG